MERFESLGPVGEGSYGTVLKCRHRESGRLVAIKKFVDSDDDKTVKKIALREIRLLRQLRHDNLVNLLEVWRRRRRWYLVFEFVERTLLEDLEQNPNGLDLNTSRLYLYQILRAAAFCHQQQVIHRDIKPENILISQGGVVKLCDFGFARTVAPSTAYTDYVATRWYRAPELLVGDTKYGKPVDVWAVGCLLVEMLTGQPLFPGDSDLDQIYHIVRCFGDLTAHHQEMFSRNPVFSGVTLPECSVRVPLEKRFPTANPSAMALAQSCLQMNPERRAQCSELLEHPLFLQDSFHIRVLNDLKAKIQKDHRDNSSFPRIAKTPRQEKDEGENKSRRGKKQPEDMDEKDNKEKEKRSKEVGEEKMLKTKGKKPKTTWSTSEPSMSTKQSKALGAKVIDHADKKTPPTRGKLGKAAGTEPRIEPEISKPTKPSNSPATSKTVTHLKANITKQKHSVEPQEAHPTNTDTKDQDSTGLRPSCSDDTVSSVTESRRVSQPEPSQDFGKSRNNSNTKAPKIPKSLTSEHQNQSSFPKTSLKLTSDPSDANLKLKTGKVSGTEFPKGAATASKIITAGRIEPSVTQKASQPPSSHRSEVKPSKTTTAPQHQVTQSNMDADQRGVECQKAVPLNQKASPSKMPKANASLEDCGCLKVNLLALTPADHTEIRDAGRHKQDCDSKLTRESTRTSTAMSSEIPKTSRPGLDKENREDLALSISAGKCLGNPTKSKGWRENSSGEAEPNCKSSKASHCRSLTGETKPTLGKAATTTTTQRSRFLFDTQKKRDDPERPDASVAGSFSSAATPDHKASARSSAFHNRDQFDLSLHNSSPPPPPPPPSCTPLLLPPTSSPFIPSYSVISTSPAPSDHLSLVGGFHPGTHSLRCVEKAGPQAGVQSRLPQQPLSGYVTGSFSAQVSEKSLGSERSFLSDRGKSDARSSMLPELRGREGKHTKGSSKDQRKDKQPGRNATDSHAT